MPYSGNPATSPVDAVRFYLQDTSATPLLNDAEIQFVLDTDTSISGNPIRAAAACCIALMAKYAGVASISADGVTYSRDQLQNKYTTLASTLRAEATRQDSSGALPQLADIQPRQQFGIGMHDIPGVYQDRDYPIHHDFCDPTTDSP